MEKTSRFQPIFTVGGFKTYGEAVFPTSLSLSAAVAASGLIGAGKPMGINPANAALLKYAAGQDFFGFLSKPVGDAATYSVGSTNAFINQMRNSLPDGRNLTPEAPGRHVGVTNYGFMSILEFEGKGDAGPDTFVTTTSTGAIATGDAAGTELALVNGSWTKAATTDWVWAFLIDANITPINTGEIRMRIQLVSPYKKA